MGGSTGSKASPQAPAGLGPSGYDPGRVPLCPFDPAHDRPSYMAWHDGFRVGAQAASAIWDRAMTMRKALPEGSNR